MLALICANYVVYAFGSGEHGQLGNGRTGEHIVSAGKTAFDVEYEPSEFRMLLYPRPVTLGTVSPCERSGRQENHTYSLRATTQYSHGL